MGQESDDEDSVPEVSEIIVKPSPTKLRKAIEILIDYSDNWYFRLARVSNKSVKYTGKPYKKVCTAEKND